MVVLAVTWMTKIGHEAEVVALAGRRGSHLRFIDEDVDVLNRIVLALGQRERDRGAPEHRFLADGR